MTAPLVVSPVRTDDFQAWSPLWAGYNAFYGRVADASGFMVYRKRL